ncbi:MAG: FKBP-type peptidyl-prolyl cis-trans isomerase [Bacteroidales bacterium]|nr:FKBP-type peptidyl-prolyl cis-trans isomerase [Bacteroidales bacterium]
MKKLILGACALLVMGAASCSKDGAADATTDNVSKATSDSISMYYGKTIGSYVLADYMRFGEEHKTENTKKDILKGVQLVLGSKADEGTLMGMQIGVQLLNELNQLKEQGIEIDNMKVFKYFKEAFEADSLDMTSVQDYSNTLNRLVGNVQQQAEQRANAAKAEEPEAVDNVKAGNDYVAQIKAQDPEVKTSASGLSYKIINKGDDTAVTDNSILDVNYVGKFTNGEVFDQNPDGQPATFSPSGVIPGFSEGLKMLGKGGRAVLYIPGELAYGAQGVPQAGIGPNQMLVFEVEVVDVKN